MIIYSSSEIILSLGQKGKQAFGFVRCYILQSLLLFSFVRLMSLIICENYSFEINVHSYIFRGYYPKVRTSAFSEQSFDPFQFSYCWLMCFLSQSSIRGTVVVLRNAVVLPLILQMKTQPRGVNCPA